MPGVLEAVSVANDTGINLELFPCAGGMAEGFKRAGITFDLAIEWMPNHCDSYEANIGHRPVCMDVNDFHQLVKLGLARPRVRLLVADPPCTPWSHAGKRKGIEDDRDMLVTTCDLIKLLQPDVFLIGNVPGLNDNKNLAIVQKYIGGLSYHGYCTADFARLDAADFGVPQHRHRPFWFGHRRDTPCIQWPEPTHGDPEMYDTSSERSQMFLPAVKPLIPWVTCRQALQQQGERIGDVEHPAVAITSTVPRVKQGADKVLAWPWDRPSTTVQTDERIAPPGHHDESFATRSLTNAVVISEEAGALLQGFPPGWKFVGKTKKSRWSQIGQAMPPPLAHAVALSVRKQMGLDSTDVGEATPDEKPARPRRTKTVKKQPSQKTT